MSKFDKMYNVFMNESTSTPELLDAIKTAMQDYINHNERFSYKNPGLFKNQSGKYIYGSLNDVTGGEPTSVSLTNLYNDDGRVDFGGFIPETMDDISVNASDFAELVRKMIIDATDELEIGS